MSRRRNCWDNDPQEWFFEHFKNCKTLDDLENEINEYMDYYNNYSYKLNLKGWPIFSKGSSSSIVFLLIVLTKGTFQ